MRRVDGVPVVDPDQGYGVAADDDDAASTPPLDEEHEIRASLAALKEEAGVINAEIAGLETILADRAAAREAERRAQEEAAAKAAAEEARRLVAPQREAEEYITRVRREARGNRLDYYLFGNVDLRSWMSASTTRPCASQPTAPPPS